MEASARALDKLRKGHYGQARNALESLLRKRPWSVPVRFNLALALEGLGLLEEAQRHLERALGLDAAHADSYYNRARLLELLDRPLEARSHWDRFLRLEPTGLWADAVRSYLGIRGQVIQLRPRVSSFSTSG